MPSKDLDRLTRIQKALRQNQWDALVLFHPDNIVMASGMLPGSTHVAAVVTADGQVLADHAVVAGRVCSAGELGRRDLDI